MDIKKTLDYLYNLTFSGIKLGLKNIENLLAEYQIPHRELKIIHVAGTNGKGSTCNILSSIYREAGYKVGLFTSPHLISFNERIKINGEMISDEDIASLAAFFREGINKHHCTFFEATTAMALKYFCDRHVDVVILEVGLGGRLDSTNVVAPLLSVITGINVDHTSYLGNSLIEITREKAGIIKQQVPVVANDNKRFVLRKIAVLAAKKRAGFFPAVYKISARLDKKSGKNRVVFNWRTEEVSALYNLRGQFQLDNLNTALTSVKVLRNVLPVEAQHICRALEKVAVRGRMEELSLEPHVIIDAAHNPQGLIKLKKEMSRQKYNTLHLVTGTVKDKDYRKYIRTVLDFDAVKYFVQPSLARGLKVSSIAAYLADYGKNISKAVKNYSCHETVLAGFRKALDNYREGDLIFVTGSHFVLADLLTEIENKNIIF